MRSRTKTFLQEIDHIVKYKYITLRQMAWTICIFRQWLFFDDILYTTIFLKHENMYTVYYIYLIL